MLPAEARAGVIAGAATERGRTFLELDAEHELARAVDVHRYVTDPARYVDPAGRVDRDAIRADLDRLVRQRPELARYGPRPGQEPSRPAERRHALPVEQSAPGRPGDHARRTGAVDPGEDAGG